ncbi:hypothetical protein FOL47_004190 [Perkinsus chesapeaki]|uniref:Uncharacterized protein n=1 Tax=Perkinsus chesapeaki TaxID=330153 RepID=A0A7J6MZ86_PERCH|nr:hypothetical protein FOL47_004190 [Perkinsus chesapeaki]
MDQPLRSSSSSLITNMVNPSQAIWFRVGCLLACIGVFTGAFGGHGLKSRQDIGPYELEVWEKAVRYQMYHSFGIVVASMAQKGAGRNWAAICFLFGILIFSGSLYALALTHINKLGAITPIGGFLMAGRTLSLFIALTFAVAIACTWWTWGYQWIYDPKSGEWPLAKCPPIEEAFQHRGVGPDGPRCQVSMTASPITLGTLVNSSLAVPEGSSLSQRRNKCVIPSFGKVDTDILCYMQDSCGNVCRTYQDGKWTRCPDPSRLEKDKKWGAIPQMCVVRIGSGSNIVNVEMPCIDVLDGAYCNEAYTLTPSNVVTMRGMVLAVGVITLFWLFAELVLRSVDKDNRKERVIGMERMAKELPVKREQIRLSLEVKWRNDAMLAMMAAAADSAPPPTHWNGSLDSPAYYQPSDPRCLVAPLPPLPPSAAMLTTPRLKGQGFLTDRSVVIRSSPELYRPSLQHSNRGGMVQSESANNLYGQSPRDGNYYNTPRGTAAANSQSPSSGSQEKFGHTLPTPLPSGWLTERSVVSTNSRKEKHSLLYSRDPRKRFESNAWRRRLRQWKELRSAKLSLISKKYMFRRVLLNCFFFIFLICLLYLILLFSPQQMRSQSSLWEVLLGEASFWEVRTWLDFLIFVDVLLDVFLFLIACLAVKWPSAPVFSRHLQDAMHKVVESSSKRQQQPGGRLSSLTAPSGGSSNSSSGHDLESGGQGGYPGELPSSTSDDTISLDFVVKQTMAQDCCLMIACHLSTMTAERFETFSNTLRAALVVFPPSHIFVCDNGPSLTPEDETQWATQQVHPDINYLYIPEGNKTFAFYWCNRYWIPYLASTGKTTNFRYAVIIDDDVPLPNDLHIPRELLEKDVDIKAVHFPITAASPYGGPNLLLQCQDIEYKMAAVHKLFQAMLSRCLSCHGAIALWDRESLDDILFEHDTVFNGEDMYMGLLLLKKRDKSKIISCAQTLVPTYAPDTWKVLFRQRVKSWELTSHKKTFTYLFELVNPSSLCHGPSWALKPYFLQELLAIALDWMRVFLVCGLLLRDWLGLLVMIALNALVLYIVLTVFQLVVLRTRKELRAGIITFVTFPWYRLSALMFRLGALCQNILVYSFERESIKIGTREDEIRDIPPCPPHIDVDWFRLWEESDPVPIEQQQSVKLSARCNSARGPRIRTPRTSGPPSRRGSLASSSPSGVPTIQPPATSVPSDRGVIDNRGDF